MITRNTVIAIANLVVGAGAYKLTNEIITNNTAPAEKLTDKVTKKAGAIAIGGAVAVKAEKYTSATINSLYDAVDQIKKSNPKNK